MSRPGRTPRLRRRTARAGKPDAAPQRCGGLVLLDVLGDGRGRKLRARIRREAVEHVFQVHQRIAACDEGAQVIDEPIDAPAGSQSLGDGALESSAFQTTPKISDVL